MLLYQVRYNNKEDHAILLESTGDLDIEGHPTCIEANGEIYYTAPHIALLEFIRNSNKHRADKARRLLSYYTEETPC